MVWDQVAGGNNYKIMKIQEIMYFINIFLTKLPIYFALLLFIITILVCKKTLMHHKQERLEVDTRKHVRQQIPEYKYSEQEDKDKHRSSVLLETWWRDENISREEISLFNRVIVI